MNACFVFFLLFFWTMTKKRRAKPLAVSLLDGCHLVKSGEDDTEGGGHELLENYRDPQRLESSPMKTRNGSEGITSTGGDLEVNLGLGLGLLLGLRLLVALLCVLEAA